MKEIEFEELKKMQCDILYKVHTFCQNNDINYSLAYGTLLGAVRHKGYIPWDDDIDIMMLRPDYDKFIHSFSGAYSELTICSPELNLDYYAPYANVWDNRTILSEGKNKNYRGMNIGVKIDVFPIDAIPNGSKRMLSIKHKILIAMLGSFSETYRSILGLKNRSIFFRIVLCIIHFCAKFIGFKNVQRFIIKFGKSYDLEKAERVDMIVFDYKNRDFSKSSFENLIDMPFEEYYFKAIANYDECLSASFGNYMKLPPKEEQIPHHNFKAVWKDYISNI